MMKAKKEIAADKDFSIADEWTGFFFFLLLLAMAYIYLSHRTDSIVRKIETAKRNLVELRAENVTLKSEVMQSKSRENLEVRLSEKGVKEPNRVVNLIKNRNDN